MLCGEIKNSSYLMYPADRAVCTKPRGHDGWHGVKHVNRIELNWLAEEEMNDTSTTA